MSSEIRVLFSNSSISKILIPFITWFRFIFPIWSLIMYLLTFLLRDKSFYFYISSWVFYLSFSRLSNNFSWVKVLQKTLLVTLLVAHFLPGYFLLTTLVYLDRIRGFGIPLLDNGNPYASAWSYFLSNSSSLFFSANNLLYLF